MEKKIFLDVLPKIKKGTNKGKIDWNNSIGYRVKFIYGDISGEIEIFNYEQKYQKIHLKYNNNEDVIPCFSFVCCNIGRILGERTNKFKIETGQAFKDEKRDIVIIDRKYKDNKKYYKYKCNKCGYNEGWVAEGDLTKGCGCSVCCSGSKTVVQGINDIPTTAPWMIKFFQNPDDAKLYTCQSSKKIKPVCPYCGKVRDKEMGINTIYARKSITCICGDGIKYPEKFVVNILNQLNLKFKTQLSRKDFDWIEKYKYDFYFELNNEQYIVETHGEQHYRDCSWSKLKDIQENDRIKKELALSSGIKEENYIVINCSLSDMYFIKNEILDSKLNELLDLTNINWVKAEEFALSNRVKESCKIWNSHPEYSTLDVAKEMNMNRVTITGYLKRGTKLGWCNYNPKEENVKSALESNKLKRKQVEIFKDGMSLGIFSSCVELEKQSEELFGVKIPNQAISAVALGKIKQHKGFTFRYV